MQTVLGAVIGVCLISDVLGGETSVRIDDQIDGKLVVPDEKPSAAVVLYHGWNGHMDEVGNMYAGLAADLSDRGIASLRINFNGEGPHADFVVTSTLQSRMREAALAFEYLRDSVSVDRYGAVGFSLGGLTTMAVIGDHPDWFDSVVLWSAAGSMNISRDPAYSEAAGRAILEGRANYTSWTEITLTREFLASFIGVTVGKNLAQYDGSLLSIRGTKDFLPALDRQWIESSPSKDKAYWMIGEADHIFNVLDEPNPGYSNQVIEQTANWLHRTLTQ